MSRRFERCLASYAMAMAITGPWSSNSCCAAEKCTIPALKLTQRHYYWGDTETVVSKVGVRLDNKGRMAYTLVAKSPKWDVTIFRNDDRTFMHWTLARFTREGIVSNFIVSQQDRLIEETGSRKITTRLGDVSVIDIAQGKMRMSYLPLGSFAAPQVESILYTTFKDPTNGGIPVRCSKLSGKGKDWMSGLPMRGREKTMLTTSNITKIKVPATFFTPPTGYTKAQSVQEVLLSRASRAASGDADELFEIGKRKR